MVMELKQSKDTVLQLNMKINELDTENEKLKAQNEQFKKLSEVAIILSDC